MEHATFWELYWERPAAVVLVALKLSKSMNIDNVKKTLDIIAEECDGWVGIIALKLRNDEKKLLSILNDLKKGLRPSEHVIRSVESHIKDNYYKH
ncbi:MAG: hypothetical protein GSR85_09025 [Desulfurococcales archaeon]|nr:hypothetical protein [Desulfurococcales archaeon]